MFSKNLRAILGPTNTGKTYFAIERMLAHSSGIMCFPLRLLARENYDKIIKVVDKNKVALITGEEKIVPKNAVYFCCTIEAMPINKKVEFVGIDEVQIASDFERGYIFTDRILNSRGTKETVFLGAETISSKLKALVPEIKIEGRPRMSSLSYIGRKKVTRIKKRSAIVAFSVADVYTIADVIRKQLGGSSIVMGALSPRTRNSQVEMYENGDVDYLVATDAIGMGLNLKIDHVSFASIRKFDGTSLRNLTDPEIAQIAGRAGRFMSDGTFGVTENSSDMSEHTIDAVENSKFDQITNVFWRNSNLDFSSVSNLIKSLETSPPEPFLIRKPDAEDHRHLVFLSEDKDVKKIAQSPNDIKLLWEVAQVPEFNKNLTNDHVFLLSKIYEQLISKGQLSNDFISSQIYNLDKITKDIDTLMQRIASIRTWTYLSHKNNWLADSNNWQETSLTIEDKLSDALNNELTNRFVDKRISVLGKKIKENLNLLIEIKSDSSIYLDSMKVGELNGFVLKLVDSSAPSSELFLKNLKKSLDAEIKKRVKNFYIIEDQRLEINDEAKIFWDASPIGWLTPSDDPFFPKIQIIQSDLLETSQVNLITEKLKSFVYNKIQKFLFPVISLNEKEFNNSARGIIFQLKEGFGTTSFKKIQKLYRELVDEDKKQLSKAGLRFGVEYLYIPELLKPTAVRLRALLWGVFNNTYYNNSLPDDGRVAFTPKESAPQQWYNIIGYSKLGDRVMRVDMVERLSVIIRTSARDGSFKISEEMLSLAGASKDQMANILSDLGFEKSKDRDGEEVTFETLFKKKSNSFSNISKLKSKQNSIKHKKKKVSAKQTINKKNNTLINPNSPFSVLSNLKLKN